MSKTYAGYETILRNQIGSNIRLFSEKVVAGGNLNQTLCLKTSMGSFLLKTNSQSQRNIFDKESRGLDCLRKQDYLHVPQVFCQGTHEGMNYLLMEWIE